MAYVESVCGAIETYLAQGGRARRTCSELATGSSMTSALDELLAEVREMR
jgi:hypothetical protein